MRTIMQYFSNLYIHCHIVIPVHTYCVTQRKVSNLTKGTSPSSDAQLMSSPVPASDSLRRRYLLSRRCCFYFSCRMSDLRDTQLDVELELWFVCPHVGLCCDTAPSTLGLSFTSLHPSALPSFHLISSTLIAIIPSKNNTHHHGNSLPIISLIVVSLCSRIKAEPNQILSQHINKLQKLNIETRDYISSFHYYIVIRRCCE